MRTSDWIALVVTLVGGGGLMTLLAWIGFKDDGHRGWHSRKNDQCDWYQSRPGRKP